MLPFSHHAEIIAIAAKNIEFVFATTDESQSMAVTIAAHQIAATRGLIAVTHTHVNGVGTTVLLMPPTLARRGPEASELSQSIDQLAVGATLEIEAQITPSIRAKIHNRGTRSGRKFSLRGNTVTRIS